MTNTITKITLDGDDYIVWWWSTMEYVTQAEYNALLPWAESDGKHYFIYSTSGWGWGWWQPWVNTLYYYNIDDNDTTSTLYDKTWNYDMTWTWTPSFTNENWLGRVIVLDWTVYSTASSYVDYWDEYTFVCVVNWDWDFYCQGASLSRVADKWLYWNSNSITFRTWNNTGYDTLDCNSNPWYWKWSIYAFVWSSTWNYRKVYVDWTLVDSNMYYNSSQWWWDYWHIGIWRTWWAITQIFNGKMKSFLAENVAWTEQEIQDYCDMIQANYWIS